MKLSMKGDYGVRALMDLAQHFGQGPVQSSEIAARQGIPEPYLDQLLTTLRKAGFINSRRGPQGGHVLARPPREITLGEVVGALEGSIAPIGCVEESSACPHLNNCAQRDVWLSITQATQKVLDTTSIEELMERQKRRQEAGMYYI